MRYYFNQFGAVYDPDNEGVELASTDAARIEAVRYAAAIMKDHPTLVWHGEDFRIEVTDANRMLLFTVIVIGVDSPGTMGR
ncbi:MAG TPA: hypothetical protein VEZ48_00630 [Sphingomonadaceae bacterium]|nr:hypothetical protein [Sphingomonadaceae bacterium]